MDNVDNISNLELSFTQPCESDTDQVDIIEDDDISKPHKEVTTGSTNCKGSSFGRRGSAYFRGDGGRREYAPEESYIFDMILDDKLQEVYALEKREREVVEQERLTFALDAFRLKYKTNGDKENNHNDDECKES